MSKELITVVTVCFNAGQTIAKTMQSVLNQTYRPLEYILVDGKSTDNTLNIIYELEPLFHEKGYQGGTGRPHLPPVGQCHRSAQALLSQALPEGRRSPSERRRPRRQGLGQPHGRQCGVGELRRRRLYHHDGRHVILLIYSFHCIKV